MSYFGSRFGVLLSLSLHTGLAFAEDARKADPEAEAKAILSVWTEEGQALCEDNAPGCAASGFALLKAARSFQMVGRLDKAIAIRRMILDPKNHLDFTQYGRETAFEIGRNYQSIAQFESAAVYYELAARKFSKESEAKEVLADAVILRLGLGDTKRAMENVDLFSKFYSRKHPEASLHLAIGACDYLVEHEDFLGAKKRLLPLVASLSRGANLGNLDDEIHAHTLLGHSFAKLGNSTAAAREYQAVQALWRDPKTATQKILVSSKNEKERSRRLGRVLSDVGEAIFFFAERKREEVEAMRFPEFKVGDDKDAIAKHISTKVAGWLRKKESAVRNAEAAYIKVLEIKPVPPPRWVIASAARVGRLWASLVSDLRLSSMPNAWNRKGKVPGAGITYADLRKVYLEQITLATEPMQMRAKAAMKKCVDYSVRYQYFDDYVEICQKWLETNYPKEFVAMDELLPLGGRTSYFVMPAPVPEPKKPQ